MPVKGGPHVFSVFLVTKMRKNTDQTKNTVLGGGGQSFNTAVFYLVSLDTINVNITFVICKTSNKEEKNLKPQLVF